MYFNSQRTGLILAHQAWDMLVHRETVGPDGFAANPVGAGHYKIVKNVQGQEVVFERFEGYWAGSPKGKPAIKTLHVRFVPELATEVTNLLGRQTDWIWNINPDQIAQINKMPHLQAVQQESMRIGYVSIDAAGRSGADNPLTKFKVRQAIWHAVNRQEM